ncbi:hypothetical protein JCM11491_000746 [Sporobolomyces phaffii]
MADPAFRGFVESTLDALLVFEGCKRGYLPKISRRLQDYEKKALVVSGAIFVFDEEETGIKRWTDGLSWSPSRTLGNFLIYRELDKKASSSSNRDEEEEQQIEKSNAASRLMGGLTSKSDPLDDAYDLAPVPSTSSHRPSAIGTRQRSLSEVAGVLQLDRARERALVGSLTSSYRFRSDGLVKKTISLSGLHLVAYYRLDDVTSGRLRTPSSHTELMSLEVSPDFLTSSLFRMPPVVEVGLDGQVRYKGESDTPISPLTRSGSSQGFPTPNLNQSRPTSSDPYSSTTPSHLTPALGNRPPSRDYPPAPGSPRRGATATVRSTNRFDPYSVGRYSPNAGAYAASTSYPFNGQIPPGQPSPNRSTFSPIDETATEYHRRDSSGETRSTSQIGENPAAHGGWYGTASGGPVHTGPYPSGRASFPGENSSSYYQPRYPTPYAPSNETNSASALFAYNPPSAGPLGRRASEGVPSPLAGYPQQARQAPPLNRPVSQQYQPSSAARPASSHQVSLNLDEDVAPYNRARPGGYPGSQYDQASNGNAHPPYQNFAPSQQGVHALASSGSARNSPAPPSSGTWNQLDLSSAALQNDPLLQRGGASRPLQAAHEVRTGYQVSGPPLSDPTYAYEALNQPSGLVAGFNEKHQPHVRGLGVSASESGPALGLYQADESYGHSQVSARPVDYRQTSQFAQPPLHPAHPAYPPTSSSSSAPVPAEQMHPYELADYPNDRDGWQQAQKPPENGSLSAQPGNGWWSPGAQDGTETFWQQQGLAKKDYPQN